MSALLQRAHLTRVTSYVFLNRYLVRPYTPHAFPIPKTLDQNPGSFANHKSVDSTTGSSENISDKKDSKKYEAKKGRKRRKKEDGSAEWDPLEENAVEVYLNSLKTGGFEPTLADLERCRPHNLYNSDSLQYELQFEDVVDRISRAFSKQQLRTFCEMYGLSTRSCLQKREYVLAIIERAWNWPSLDEIRRRKLAETITEQMSYEVTPSQLFLILGKDGIALLRMSVKYNTHISLKAQPLQLEIEGTKASVEKLISHLTKFTETIIEDTFQTPTGAPVRADLVPRLSRLTNTFIENVDQSGTVRICTTSREQVGTASRLIIRALCEVAESSSDRLVAHIPSDVPSATPIPLSLFPNNYAAYPFMSPRSLPWTMNTGGTFRIRRIGEWLGTSSSEDIGQTGGLAEGKGRVISLDGREQDIKTSLLAKLPEPQVPFQTTVTACLGHALLTSPSAGRRANIVPPITGFLTMPKILEWLQHAEVHTAFLPSLPFPLLHAPPSKQRMLLRLIYRSLPDSSSSGRTGVIKIDIELPRMDGSETKVAREISDETPDESTAQLTFGDEKMGDFGASASNSKSGDLPHLKIRCWHGQETSVIVMLPDRPMDVRFSAFHSCELPAEGIPPDLREFPTQIRDFLVCENADIRQPLPPLRLIVDGQTYILNANISIRQNLEDVPEGRDNVMTKTTLHFASESILDIESRHRMLRCQVSCSDMQSPDSWKEFLRSCDRLSSVIYRPTLGFTRASSEDINTSDARPV